MTETRVGRPTAVDDVYPCRWGIEQRLSVLPTGHESLKPAWLFVHEPNDCMPIAQSLAVGYIGHIVVVGDRPAPAEVNRLDFTGAYSAYETRRREALNGRVADTLNDLALTYGAAWVDIAAVLGVSVPALRKWRLGEAKPRRHLRERLAAYVACLAALRECGVEEPAGRLEMRILDSYTVTLTLIFEPERVSDILRYTSGDLSPVELLNQAEPNWRQLYAAKTRIYLDGDGELAMRILPER